MTREDFSALLDMLTAALGDVMAGPAIGASLWRVAAVVLMVLLVAGLTSSYEPKPVEEDGRGYYWIEQ